jgi:methionyl-tRNA formyltransferase
MLNRGGGYNIVILSDESSWINSFLLDLELDWRAQGHNVVSAHNSQDALASVKLLMQEAKESNKTCLCFCLSYSKILSAEFRNNFQHTLIVHESDLPGGKGWSPLTWQILEGKKTIPVCLIEAVDRVDSGPIYARETIQLNGHELVDELREAQAKATMNLCTAFVGDFPHSLKNAKNQTGDATFYSRRRPEDSQLDPRKSILEQFNLLRIVDNDRYPAFFDIENRRYHLKVSAVQKHD